MKRLFIILAIVLAAIAGVLVLVNRFVDYETSKSYLGKTKDELKRPLTRGYRNNNAGNIKINANNDWAGKIPAAENTDGTFEQFTALAYGTRALIKLVQRYIADGNRTIFAIATKYAPAVENDTKKYADSLSLITGLDRAFVLKADKSTIQLIVQGISKVENGRSLTLAEFEAGWKLL